MADVGGGVAECGSGDVALTAIFSSRVSLERSSPALDPHQRASQPWGPQPIPFILHADGNERYTAFGRLHLLGLSALRELFGDAF